MQQNQILLVEYSGLTDADDDEDDGELLNGEVSGVGGVPRGAGR